MGDVLKLVLVAGVAGVVSVGSVIAFQTFQGDRVEDVSTEQLEAKDVVEIYEPVQFSDGDVRGVLDEQRVGIKEAVDSTLVEITANQDKYDHGTKTENIAASARDYALGDIQKRNGEEKIRYAASVFAGYMVRNTLGNQEYCDRFGIDISEFRAAFRQQDTVLVSKAMKYYPSAGWEAILYSEVKPQIMPLIEQEFEEASKLGGLSGDVLCKRLNTAKDAVIGQMKFEKIMPEIYQVIITAP